jgi:uncharacterized YccA/Bax inhibitor family protein
MAAIKLSIILQLTGAIDGLTGILLVFFASKGALPAGILLVLVGVGLFLAGRIVLHYSLKNRHMALLNYKESVMQTVMDAPHSPYAASESLSHQGIAGAKSYSASVSSHKKDLN